MPSLYARQLHYHYSQDKPLLSGIDLTIPSGEILGILGPNGAGKTTLFSLLSGLIHPMSGEILVDKHVITKHSLSQRAQQGIVYLPQGPSIFRRMSVRENLCVVLEKPSSIVDKMLDRFQLTQYANQLAGSLSGGQRRRLEIARSLLLEPTFMLLDEPFAGIDPITIADIKKQLTTLADEGIGIIITDHNVEDTLTLCHKAILLYQGQILCEGHPQQVRQHSQARSLYFGDTSPNPAANKATNA